jgi:glucose/arabinose dehydrogenase
MAKINLPKTSAARSFIGWILVLLAASCAQVVVPSTSPVSSLIPSPTAAFTHTVPAATVTITIPGTATITPKPALPTSTPSPLSPTFTAAPLFPKSTAFHWKLLASGLYKPNTITNAGDGSGRLFIIEQDGRVRIIKHDQLQRVAFLDIRDRVDASSLERGLLGMAFHPYYQENGFFYVNYTDKNGNTIISRFSVSANTDLADPASEKILLSIDQPYANHNGGCLVFGLDGYLYIGTGDGGSSGDPQDYAQSLDSLLGKLLRIDVDHGDPYAIPPDNPFANGGGRPEILDYGLRNPWRFSFDRQTGDLYIGDVGQENYEEINFLPGGYTVLYNLGWNYREGLHAYSNRVFPGKIPYIDPVLEYDHTQGCAVIGGVVYRGQALAELTGIYLFGDYCQGRIWGLRQANGQWLSAQLFRTSYAVTAFGEDEQGEVYLADLNGNVLRLERK